MAFAVSTNVRIADQSSAYRGHRGQVMRVDGDNHYVRVDQHGCHNRVLLRTDQLKEDFGTQLVDYRQC